MESQMQQILSKARTLIEAKRYEDARALLITVDHPTAEKWLAKLNQIIASAQTPAVGSPPLQPIASARLSSQEATPMHSGNSSAQPAYYQPLTQSFTGKFVATIVLFFILILPGLIALSIFSREAEEAQKRSQVPIPGARELIALRRNLFIVIVLVLLVLIVFGLLPAANAYIQCCVPH